MSPSKLGWSEVKFLSSPSKLCFLSKAIRSSANGLGDTRSKEAVCQCRRRKRLRFDPWVRRIPWSRKWQPTLVFLSEKSCGQRSLAGYSPWGRKELDTTEVTQHTWRKELDTTEVTQHTWMVPPSPPPTETSKAATLESFYTLSITLSCQITSVFQVQPLWCVPNPYPRILC